MVDPKNGWLDIGIQSVVATMVVAVYVMGCASSPTPMGADTGSVVQTIGAVSVARDGEDSLVRLEGLVDPIYSVTTPGDANLVVVDLVGVGKPDAENLMGAVRDEDQQIAAYDGVVDLVTLSTFEEEGEMPLTRVEIVMAETGRAEVVSTGDGLEIRIVRDLEDAALVANEDGSEDWGSESASPEPWQDADQGSDDGPLDHRWDRLRGVSGWGGRNIIFDNGPTLLERHTTEAALGGEPRTLGRLE